LQPNEALELSALNDELKHVGRLPRLLSVALAIVFLPLVWVGWMASHQQPIAFAFTAIPLALVAFALPLRSRATAEELVVYSYFKIYRIRFTEVLVFADVPYSGMWNRSADTEGWLNAGMRMIDVTNRDGTGYSLRASLSGRKACEQAVSALNARLRAG